ncbi:hypothetical protein STEG23_026026, partial [Scotinomys teguina]
MMAEMALAGGADPGVVVTLDLILLLVISFLFPALFGFPNRHILEPGKVNLPVIYFSDSESSSQKVMYENEQYCSSHDPAVSFQKRHYLNVFACYVATSLPVPD